MNDVIMDDCPEATRTYGYQVVSGGQQTNDAFIATFSGTVTHCGGGGGGGGESDDSFSYNLKQSSAIRIGPLTSSTIAAGLRVSLNARWETSGEPVAVKWSLAHGTTGLLLYADAISETPLADNHEPIDKIWVSSSLIGSYIVVATLENGNAEDRAVVNVYDLDVTIEQENNDWDGAILTDNRKGEIILNFSGPVNVDELVISITAKPLHDGELINKYGANINIEPTDDPQRWTTSQIYWYGLQPDEICYKFIPEYIFSININGYNAVKSIRVSVLFPIENPVALFVYPTKSDSVVLPPEPVPGVGNFFRSEIKFEGFPLVVHVDHYSTSQYKDEVYREETFHEAQIKGLVPKNEGGQGDLYTRKGILWALGWIGINDPIELLLDSQAWYVYGSTPEITQNLAIQYLLNGEQLEMEYSRALLIKNRGFMELKAKEHAGYNAAFTYSCTHQDIFGANPINYTHRAHQ